MRGVEAVRAVAPGVSTITVMPACCSTSMLAP